MFWLIYLYLFIYSFIYLFIYSGPISFFLTHFFIYFRLPFFLPVFLFVCLSVSLSVGLSMTYSVTSMTSLPFIPCFVSLFFLPSSFVVSTSSLSVDLYLTVSLKVSLPFKPLLLLSHSLPLFHPLFL